MTPTTPYFVYTPNPFVCDGQSIVPCDLKPGESLKGFLLRHAPHLTTDGWIVSIGGAEVAPAMWGKTFPKEGMHIACRAVVGKQAVQLVAMVALTYFTFGFGAVTAGMWGAGAIAGSLGALGAIGVYMAGSILINKVLGPKVPKFGETPAAKQVYNLSSQRNSARAYEPIGTLWGEMRVTPDLAGQPYTWYESDEQYLSTILLGGVNVHSVSDLSIGDTPITSYQDVSVYYNGFAGMTSQSLPLYSNADSLAGGEVADDGTWVQRTSSVDAINLQVDIEYAMYLQGTTGLLWVKSELKVEYRPVGTPNWLPAVTRNISSNSTEPKRLTLRWAVPKGQYDVRVRQTKIVRSDGNLGGTRNVTWTTLRTVQPDTTNYSQFGRIGIRIKATGQLSGSLDTVRATYRAKPMPIWTGTAWATATTRENGLSNPGAIILQTLRGVKHNGKLQFGFGLADEDIDIEGLKAFMLHCAANGYTYDRWVTSEISLMEFCDEVARAGMGEFAWTDGSRPTAMFVAPGQPTSAVVNMANMAKASFSVDYAVASTADGIEYQYVDRARNFETSTIRVNAPGVTTPLNPARITGEGVTTEAHAARMARFHLGQSLYQYKTIHFGANIEHLDYRRLSVLSVSHDLTQWGFGGRVQEVVVGQGFINVRLDEPVPPLATRKLGLRLPGERDYRVWDVTPFTGSQEVLTLVGDWPSGERVPGDGDDNPAHDTLWCYDFKSTPGYRVRVVNVEPEKDLSGADITCVPEGPEFWDYVLNGTYVPAPNPSALPQLARPSVQNVRVTEQTNIQGNTRWWQLNAVWESQGAAEYCQVWAGLDGSELALVDARATGNRSSWRIEEPGEYLIQVRPFDASGRAGDAVSVVYVTAGVAVPPVNASNFVVHELAGGLRRFAWAFAGDTPVAFAGVQIRYASGDTQVSAASWGDLTPLGDADDIYTAQFETTKPPAGLYTFALRTINTSGQLSANVLRFVVNLSGSFEQVQQVDLTPPPVPENLTATGAFATVQVRWGAPTYTQGHGHARTEVWAGATSDRAGATKVAEAYAGPVSFEWALGSTVYVWARHITVDGVAGGWAGPVMAQTAQDIEQVTDLLKGQFDESHLKQALVKRIDAIDVGSPELGKSLIASAASLEATQQKVRTDMNDMAQGLLEAALAADAALERITDAGVYVDPATGTVKIYGLEVTKEEVTDLQVLLDTLNGQLQLKATTAYVDGKIAEAVLSPADLLLYEGLDARVVSVTQTLDSINGTLAQKASALELQNALLRLSTAESNLDALSGQIALRVTRAEYTADQGALNSRLSSAELTLNALDVPSIQATVQAVSGVQKNAEKQAQALLQDILTGERNYTETQQTLAFARSELSAAIQDGLQAEAQQRTQLATQFGQQMSAVEQSLSSLSAADMAEAAARLTLAAKVEREQQQLQAQIETESQARADAVSAEAQQRQQLASRLDNTDGELLAAIQTEQQTRADAVSAEASARQTLAATVSSNHSTALAAAQAASDSAGSKGKVLFQNSAPATADQLAQNLWIDTTGGANTPKRWNGSTWAVVTDKAATDAAAAAAAAQITANNAVAEIQTEQSVRANETGHLGAQYTVRMQLGQGGQQVVGGFGLSGTSSATEGARIDFGVLANSFWVAAPNGSSVANVKPFSVQTTAQTVNGVVVPAGVYMDAAYINNATVLWGRFGTLVADSIQATAISASQLTAGNGVIGGTLRSSNYVAGSSGWTLRPDGVAEFSGVTVRGTVYATAGTVGGWSIGSNYLRSSNYASGVRGVSFGSDGTVEIRSADGARVLNMQATGSQPVLAVPGLSILGNGSATFSGNLSAASGSFSGTLTADNIVNTSHMVDGAASAGVSVYLAGEVTFSNYDTQVEVASVAFNASGGRVLALVGLGISALGRVTSSGNPLIRVRLLRNGSEVRRIDVPAMTETINGTTRSEISGAAFSLPPLSDSPGAGWHAYSVTVEARGMGTNVSVTARQRGLAILEMKR